MVHWHFFIFPVLVSCCYAGRSRGLWSLKKPLESVAKRGGSGQAKSPAQHIIDGTPGDEGAFPFMAKIAFADGHGFCGGTLISANYVMTAGHCARDIYIGGVEKARVGLGTNLLNNAGGLYTTIESAFVCPDFTGSAVKGKDLAILKLSRPVDYPPLIQPIHLYGGDVNFTLGNVTVAGWGIYSLPNDTAVHEELAPSLLYTEVPTVNFTYCNKIWKVYGDLSIVDDEMICAGTDGRGSFSGDSGGPLMAQDPTSGVWYEAGIISFGPLLEATFHQGVYARVSTHCDFIEEVTGGEAACGTTMPGTPRPPSNCPVGWRPSNAVTNKCYYTFEDITDQWTIANAYCSNQANGSTLVSIQNGFEGSAVADEFRARGNYWIGLNATGGTWIWIDGQNLTYTNWANGEPSQSSGCAVVDPSTTKWRVAACDDVHLAVCELFI